MCFFWLFILLLGGAAGPVEAQAPEAQDRECWRGVLCVEVAHLGGGVHFFVENLGPGTLTVELDVRAQGLTSDESFPHVGVYRPGRSPAFTLEADDPYAGWQYEYALRWMHGRLSARHEADHVYRLPYAPGTAHQVLQGFNGPFSHRGKHAIDWEMREGTPVHAARGGLVVAAVDTFEVGGMEERYRAQGNYVHIEHADGTVGSYLHLMPGGAAVAVGQTVRKGQLIGYAGSTGYASGPHLHFEVFAPTPDLRRRTVPVRFGVEEGRAAYLREGRTYPAD